MKIRPLENYKLLGTSIQLDKTQVYDAIPASNQPDYIRDGKVFAGDMLLVREEYEVVPPTRKQELLASWEERIARIVADVHGVISFAEAAEYERVTRDAQRAG